MPNSADGNNASILAGQTQQANEDRIAERIASAVSKTKRGLHNKLMAASSAAEAMRRAEGLLKIKTEYALEAVYELRHQHRLDPAGKPKPVSSNAGAGTWSVANSEYDITELVRLFFADKLKPASLKTCVKLLQLAEKESVAPENFRRFMRNVGGIDVNVKLLIKSAKQPGPDATSLKRPAEGR
jgi:hypothetical protein